MDKINTTVIAALVIGAIIGFLVNGQFSNKSASPGTNESVQASAQPSAEAGSKEAKIAEALSAAPETVATNATVMDFPEKAGGDLVELQKGTNDWTCFPDYPGSPGKDPMCVDKQGMLWLQAYITQKPPNLTQAGLAYMLQGGSDASNTDPFAQKPTEGEDWITTPSHTMIFPNGKLDQTVYSKDPQNGGPWIMWAGTPYEHLMVPVK
jgi:hypothetical protein